MLGPGHKIRLRSSARSDTGKVRDNNEDNVRLSIQNDVVVAIVADGMGGAVAGEEASRIAVEQICNQFFEHTLDKVEEDQLAGNMRDAITYANEQIVIEAQQHPELKGMGTTVTMAVVRGTRLILGHVGDSRAYLVDGDDGEIIQVTSDHSFVQALVTAGHISAEEAEDHPMRNVLYRALGQSYDIEVDLYFEKISIGDRIVLCSDGLTLHLNPNEIAQIVTASDDPDETSQKLIDLANSRGGKDNVSAIVINVERDTHGDTQTLKPHKIVEPQYSDDDTLILDRNNTFASSESPAPIEPQEDTPPTEDTLSAEIISSNETSSHSYGEGKDPSRRDM